MVTYVGNNSNNTIYGSNVSDNLSGNGGDDIIYGYFPGDANHVGVPQYQTDILSGGDGNDQIFVGTGAAHVTGGSGNDAIICEGGNIMFAHLQSIFGGDGDDYILGGNGPTNAIWGDDGADIIIGRGRGTDTIHGGTGNDTITFVGTGIASIYGDGGLDDLLGGNSTDFLSGGADNDRLNGDQGSDQLQGDGGADTFIFEDGTGNDTISDFVHGTDKIDLSDFNFANYAAVQALMSQSGGTTTIGLGGGDSVIVTGVTMATFTASDFIL